MKPLLWLPRYPKKQWLDWLDWLVPLNTAEAEPAFIQEHLVLGSPRAPGGILDFLGVNPREKPMVLTCLLPQMHVDHIGISSVGFPLKQLGDEGEDCKQPMVCVLVAMMWRNRCTSLAFKATMCSLKVESSVILKCIVNAWDFMNIYIYIY